MLKRSKTIITVQFIMFVLLGLYHFKTNSENELTIFALEYNLKACTEEYGDANVYMNQLEEDLKVCEGALHP